MVLQKAHDFIRQNRYQEALLYLRTIQQSSHKFPGVDLLWGQIAAQSEFSYLGVIAAQSELDSFNSSEAKAFIEQLRNAAQRTRASCPSDFPYVTHIGILSEGTTELWKRCADSLDYQGNRNVDFVLCNKVDEEIEEAIRNARGDIVSIVEDPSTIFSDRGLLFVSAVFKSSNDVSVLQTERIMYSAEGLQLNLRNNLPQWSESLLLDPVNLEEPTLLFSWRGVYFKRNVLINEGLPLRKTLRKAQSLDVALRIIKKYPIHTVKLQVILDNAPISKKSIQLTLGTISDALQVIKNAKADLKNEPSTATAEIIEITKQQRVGNAPPVIAPEILVKGKLAALPISLVTASFNNGDYLEKCIDSILSQNYPNLQYGIMDGGSTDQSVSIIKKYEKYLSFWRSERDNGHYAAIQEGFQNFTGSIFSWLNADDFMLPYSFELVSALFAENSEVEWITGLPCMTDGIVIEMVNSIPVYKPQEYLQDGFDAVFIQQEGTFWRRSLWEKAGSSLDLRLQFAADTELWIRFFEHACLYSVSVSLGVFRERKGQRSAIYRNKYFAEAVSAIDKFHLQNRKPFPMPDNVILRVPIVEQKIN